MRRFWFSLSAFPFALVLASLFSGRAATTNAALPDHGTRDEAVSLLKVINMAELDFQTKNGAFATWPELVKSKEFLNAKQIFSRYDAKLAQTQFREQTEVLTGWDLKLRVDSGGKGYNIILADTTDHRCASALFTDEVFFIWEGKAVGCVD